MKITLLSYEDSGGGAGRAALKLQHALEDFGVDSKLRVARKRTDQNNVIGHSSLLQKISRNLNEYISNSFINRNQSINSGFKSLTIIPNRIDHELNNSDTDIIQLNWISGLISIAEIARLKKPLVWRLSDMWAFSGVEHYVNTKNDFLWRRGLNFKNKTSKSLLIDFDRWAWRKKKQSWKNPINIVTPSKWLADCVKESELMHNWPVTVIPTAINTNLFKPFPKQVARDLFELPKNRKIILFGALGGGKDLRKGKDFLMSALKLVSKNYPDAIGVIFGESQPINPPRLGMPLYWVGHLNDDVSLAILYSTADVMVIPSRQDNLPQTGVEAQCCGCPVVTFNASGLPDLIEHKLTGYLARAHDVKDLANGIEWVINNKNRQSKLSHRSRQRACLIWSKDVVVSKYLDLYKEILEKNNN